MNSRSRFDSQTFTSHTVFRHGLHLPYFLERLLVRNEFSQYFISPAIYQAPLMCVVLCCIPRCPKMETRVPGLGIPGQNQVRDRTIHTFVWLNGSSLLELGAKGAYSGSFGIHDTFSSIIAYSVDLCPSFPKANCFCYDSTWFWAWVYHFEHIHNTSEDSKLFSVTLN